MNKKQLGEFIRSKRIECNLSQAKLADKIGRRRQAVFEIEADKVDFGILILLDILKSLGYCIEVVPIEKSCMFDFSKIDPLPIIPQTFKKQKTKRHEKSNRRSSR